MEKINEKSTSELQSIMKQLEIEHETLKHKMLKEWDVLIGMERMATEINKELKKRNNQ
jgi:hypothetical protein